MEWGHDTQHEFQSGQHTQTIEQGANRLEQLENSILLVRNLCDYRLPVFYRMAFNLLRSRALFISEFQILNAVFYFHLSSAQTRGINKTAKKKNLNQSQEETRRSMKDFSFIWHFWKGYIKITTMFFFSFGGLIIIIVLINFYGKSVLLWSCATRIPGKDLQ